MKRQPVKAPVVYFPHSTLVCSDCGVVGCWIPVPHKANP